MLRTIAHAVAVLLALTCATPLAADAPAYGEPRLGFQAALEDLGNARVRLHLLNRSPANVDLSSGFAWLLLVESRQHALFSDKLPLASDKPLAPDQSWTAEYDLTKLTFYPFQPGAKLVDGYPDDRPDPATLDALPPTPRAQLIVNITVAGERTTLRTRAHSIATRADAPLPNQVAEDLLRAFRRDAFAAQRAHERAILAGESLLPTWAAALDDPDMPDFALMWIATAVIRINAGAAPDLAAQLASHPNEGVRNVLAYHGPSMKRENVDHAILQRAAAGQDPLFTAWAARGFAHNRRAFPDGLTTAAFASREPRARAEIADLLAASGDPRLAQLARDPHELVRVAVADAVSRHQIRRRELMIALAESLNKPGEAARERIVDVLATLSEQPWQYSREQSADETSALFQTILKWAQQSLPPQQP